jgi:hypothetical protein
VPVLCRNVGDRGRRGLPSRSLSDERREDED